MTSCYIFYIIVIISVFLYLFVSGIAEPFTNNINNSINKNKRKYRDIKKYIYHGLNHKIRGVKKYFSF